MSDQVVKHLFSPGPDFSYEFSSKVSGFMRRNGHTCRIQKLVPAERWTDSGQPEYVIEFQKDGQELTIQERELGLKQSAWPIVDRG